MGIRVLHLNLSVDYHKNVDVYSGIPNRNANARIFPFSTISSLFVYLNRIYTPINIEEKQVIFFNFIQCIFFHFSTPLNRPTIFFAFDCTAKAKPNKEGMLESKRNRPK